ncbi:hypothetical protein LLH23_20600 [bacterium]|nr:hypothetical protein [bacterium]
MRKRVLVVAAVCVVLVLAGVLSYALAQPPGGGMGPGMMGGPPGGGGAAIAVSAGGVYVVSGGQVMKLDPDTLKVLATAELPRPEPPPNN